MSGKEYVVAFDDVALQLSNTGIARYWRELMTRLVENDVFKDHNIKPIFLSRSSFRTPLAEQHLEFPKFNFQFPAADRQLISAFCESENVDLFVSSYYTFSVNKKNLVLFYDLIPEVFGFERMNRGWMERQLAFHAASSLFTISENSKNDMNHFYPHTKEMKIGIGYPGIDPVLFNSDQKGNSKESSSALRHFVCVGARYGEGGYKNGKLLVNAINSMAIEEINFELYFIGGEALTLEEIKMSDEKRVKIHTGRLSDSEMVSVIRSADALIYPTKYEGFGIPPLESLAVGTPVITTNCSSIPEVVGDLALFVDFEDASGLANLLLHKDFIELKESIGVLGPERASEFTWEKTTKEFSLALVRALAEQEDPLWKKRLEILREYSEIAVNLQH